MCLYVLFYVLVLFFTPLNGFGDDDHDDISNICTTRFEYRHELKKQYQNCSRVIELNPVCGRKVTVAYSGQPPYVCENNGNVDGVLPKMLEYAFDSCCFGCQTIEYVGPHVGLSRFYQNASIVLPIQTASKMDQFFGHDFVHMLEINAVSVVGPRVHMKVDDITRTIFESIFSTWPLFATASLMAIVAGVIMWLLESGNNRDQFPHSFPQGPFEGFWWAVVSMTTVGYGDRSPRTFAGRIVAIIWILVGITIFSIFSATMTSSLTTSVMAFHKINLRRNLFAVLDRSTIGMRAMMSEQAMSKGYNSVETIRRAIIDKEVNGMAVDENIANFYAEHMAEEDEITYQLYKRIPISGSCYGLVSYDPRLTRMLRSFYDSNDDQKSTMSLMAMGEHIFDKGFEKLDSGTLSFIGTKEMLFTTLGFLVLLSIFLVVIGLIIKRLKERKNKCRELLCKNTTVDNGKSHVYI